MAGFQLPSFKLLLIASLAAGAVGYNLDPAAWTSHLDPQVKVVRPAQPIGISSVVPIPICGTWKRVTCVVDGDTT